MYNPGTRYRGFFFYNVISIVSDRSLPYKIDTIQNALLLKDVKISFACNIPEPMTS